MRKYVWYANVLVLLAALVGIAYGLYGTHVLTFTERDIQSKIDAKLPVAVGKQLSVVGATVHLIGGDIKIFAEVEDTRTRNLHVLAQAFGRPVYKDGEFWFDAEKVEVIGITWRGQSITSGLQSLTRRMMLRPDNLYSDVEPVGATEKHTKALAEAGAKALLTNLPAYRVKDDFKGHLFKATVQDVSLKDGKLHVVFSAWGVTLQAGLFLLLAVLACGLMAAMVMHPELFISLVAAGALSG